VDEVPKILPNSQVTFEADARAAGEPMEGVGHPADGTLSPEVGNDGPGEAEPVTEAPEVVPVPGAAPAPEPAAHVPPRPPRRPVGGGNA